MALCYRHTSQQQDTRRLPERRDPHSGQARSGVSQGAKDVAGNAENRHKESEEETDSEHAWPEWRERVQWAGYESTVRKKLQGR